MGATWTASSLEAFATAEGKNPVVRPGPPMGRVGCMHVYSHRVLLPAEGGGLQVKPALIGIDGGMITSVRAEDEPFGDSLGPEVDHLGARGLQDPPHHVDGRVVAVEQGGRRHDADVMARPIGRDDFGGDGLVHGERCRRDERGLMSRCSRSAKPRSRPQRRQNADWDPGNGCGSCLRKPRPGVNRANRPRPASAPTAPSGGQGAFTAPVLAPVAQIFSTGRDVTGKCPRRPSVVRMLCA